MGVMFDTNVLIALGRWMPNPVEFAQDRKIKGLALERIGSS